MGAVNKGKKAAAKSRPNWTVSDSEEEGPSSRRPDGGNKRDRSDDDERDGPAAADHHKKAKAAGEDTEVEMAASGDGEGQGGGNGGGGGLGRTLSDQVNEVFFHDTGFTVVSTRNIWAASTTDEVYNISSTLGNIVDNHVVWQVNSDWYMMDFNAYHAIMIGNAWQRIINEYEMWKPVKWGLEMSGWKFINTNEINGTKTSGTDLTAAMSIAVRTKEDIPYQLWGWTDGVSPIGARPWAVPPWQVTQMAKWNYITKTYSVNSPKPEPYIVEKGAVAFYTSTDDFRIGGHFGQASWMHNHRLANGIQDPKLTAPLGSTELSTQLTNASFAQQWTPSINEAGRVQYGIGSGSSNDIQIEYSTTAKYNSDVNNDTSKQYNREQNMETSRNRVNDENADEPITGQKPWDEVKSNSLFPQKTALTNAGNKNGGTGTEAGLSDIPIWTVRPFNCSVHRPKFSSHVVENPPPMVLYRVKPQLSYSLGAYLDTTCQFQAKVVMEFKAKRWTRPRGWIGNDPMYNPEPDTGNGFVWPGPNISNEAVDKVDFPTMPAWTVDTGYPYGPVKNTY